MSVLKPPFHLDPIAFSAEGSRIVIVSSRSRNLGVVPGALRWVVHLLVVIPADTEAVDASFSRAASGPWLSNLELTFHHVCTWLWRFYKMVSIGLCYLLDRSDLSAVPNLVPIPNPQVLFLSVLPRL